MAAISLFLQPLSACVDPAQRRVRWTPLAASTAAVLMALAEGALGGRFREAHRCLAADYRRRRRTGATYNGLLKALERQQHTVLPRVKAELRAHVRRRLQRIDPAGRWVLLAVDGSKEDLPRTRAHEVGFGIADNGRFPQAFVTAVVEVYTGLLWDWRLGPARASEKRHALEMIADLPDDALLLADAGFVGLPIWSTLQNHGKHFLIRVGGNVRLLTDLWPQTQTRRRKDLVYVWPKKGRQDHPPLKLRLIRVGSGPKTVHLLTNVLDPRPLSRKMAGAIYRRRWGVELFYRTFKRTLGCAKLHSKSARRATIEFEWALVAITLVTLLGIDALVRRRRDPRRLSAAPLLGALREALRRDLGARGHTHEALQRALGRCLKDTYQRRRSKLSRHRFTTVNTPTKYLQPPNVRPATAQEQADAQKYGHRTAA